MMLYDVFVLREVNETVEADSEQEAIEKIVWEYDMEDYSDASAILIEDEEAEKE